MNILYYPEINIPRTEWAIRAFLYYDEVAAIGGCVKMHTLFFL